MPDIAFPAPSVPLSENDARGRSWAVVRARLKPWKDLTWAATRNAIARGVLTPGKPITVTVDLPFTTRRTRDPHNYTSTVVKAIVDGLTLARLVPDDSPEWVTVNDPVIRIRTPATVVVHIEERHP